LKKLIKNFFKYGFLIKVKEIVTKIFNKQVNYLLINFSLALIISIFLLSAFLIQIYLGIQNNSDLTDKQIITYLSYGLLGISFTLSLYTLWRYKKKARDLKKLKKEILTLDKSFFNSLTNQLFEELKKEHIEMKKSWKIKNYL
jgi:hypothetical protein